jgi:hypothetical protein
MLRYYKLGKNIIVDEGTQVSIKGVISRSTKSFSGSVIGDSGYYTRGLPKQAVEITKGDYNKKCIEMLDKQLKKDIKWCMEKIKEYEDIHKDQVNKFM